MTEEGSGRIEATFAPDADAARQVRMVVGDGLEAFGLGPALITDTLLVLTELVANAVRHARTEFTVSTALKGERVRIEVFDLDTRPPALMGLDSESTSGRGLHIVSGIAQDWGWNTAEGEDGVAGKVVWAELAVDAPGTDNRA